MFEISDDAKGGFRRVEILTGPGRRRKWSAEEKGRIVAETLDPGARVSEVARRWQVCPQQIFGWRRGARQELQASREEQPGPRQGFVPIITGPGPIATAGRSTSTAAVIEVKLAGAVIRVVSGNDDGTQLAAVLRALRASAVGKCLCDASGSNWNGGTLYGPRETDHGNPFTGYRESPLSR